MVSSGGTLFFVANDGNTGYSLWKSDGAEAGTVLVKDIHPDRSQPPDCMLFPVPDLQPPLPYGLVDVDGTLFFVADDGNTGYSLWKSDGTEGRHNPCERYRSGFG